MAFNTKEQEIIRYGLQNGKTKEEVTQAITNYRSGVVTQPKPQTKEEPFNLAKETIKGLPKAAAQVLVDPAVKFGVSALASPVDLARQAMGKDPLSGQFPLPSGDMSKTIQSDFTDKATQVAEGNMSPIGATAGTVLDTVLGAGDVLGAEQLAKGGVQLAKTGVNLAKNSINSIGSKAVQTVEDIGSAIKTSVAKQNVNPQLESSANRLFLQGTNKLESPVATYDTYLNQSKNAIKDIKADPAISTVGEKIGNAFEQVVKQRSSIGEVLGKELKANGKFKINITEPKSSFLNELKDSGLSYNPKTNNLTSFQGTKFVPEEIDMLNKFTKDMIALGDNPTVSSIDNFIAKTRSELQFTKGKTGVMGGTNAERIINKGIADLKETLNPAVNRNTNLDKYWQANQAYSQLSDFIDEGSTFLGKKTLSGDFAKDASIAKSSVQSILNQGKKDFLVKLQDLTGYNAIDDAVLSLQAMKDAGDFRGLSLLQAISESGVPTSKSGATQKILDYVMDKGGRIVAGSPEEQTRAFLQSLEKTDIKNTTTNAIKSGTANTGTNINNSSQINNSDTVINQNKVKASNADTISNTSNRIIKESVPQKEGVIQKLINSYKALPNKQGGFVRLPISNKIVKAIDEMTKREIYDLDKYLGNSLKTGETNKGMEKTLDLIMEKFEISPDLSVTQIRTKLRKLMDNTKTR